ncbi:hypothetical protein TOPH_00506 [Tolypocladium ophioglossoides CBS 100239]|uniref:Uncharacterized protein n=1 Tax=Tolypocladium ophioglossoides (strain CBS 100239) TaxID=1163406 RepID=A0A0L0NMD9_TOLOC|nr:hypothetical protein TOPH_00506 [Tolypocladium ophioglossoides CBS 100239]
MAHIRKNVDGRQLQGDPRPARGAVQRLRCRHCEQQNMIGKPPIKPALYADENLTKTTGPEHQPQCHRASNGGWKMHKAWRVRHAVVLVRVGCSASIGELRGLCYALEH